MLLVRNTLQACWNGKNHTCSCSPWRLVLEFQSRISNPCLVWRECWYSKTATINQFSSLSLRSFLIDLQHSGQLQWKWCTFKLELMFGARVLEWHVQSLSNLVSMLICRYSNDRPIHFVAWLVFEALGDIHPKVWHYFTLLRLLWRLVP